MYIALALRSVEAHASSNPAFISLSEPGDGFVAITLIAAKGSENSERKFISAIPSAPITGKGQSAEHTGLVGP